MTGPIKRFLVQTNMFQVCYALVPSAVASVYFFGWRAFMLLVVSLAVGAATEAVFVFREGKPVTSAVLVTAMIFALSLPPTLPFWMAALGVVVAVALGKMAFGGLGMNIFNPAMVGRCFLYVAFPIQMTNRWTEPFSSGAGFGAWAGGADAITRATPLRVLRDGGTVPWFDLLSGATAGSAGETAAWLAILGGVFLVIRKVAPWRIPLACIGAAALTSELAGFFGSTALPGPAETLFSGSLLFGAAFVATEPITGAKTPEGQWIYGAGIGAVTVLFRGFSNFSEGVMFAVLLFNGLVPVLDRGVGGIQARRGRHAEAQA